MGYIETEVPKPYSIFTIPELALKKTPFVIFPTGQTVVKMNALIPYGNQTYK